MRKAGTADPQMTTTHERNETMKIENTKNENATVQLIGAGFDQNLYPGQWLVDLNLYTRVESNSSSYEQVWALVKGETLEEALANLRLFLAGVLAGGKFVDATIQAITNTSSLRRMGRRIEVHSTSSRIMVTK